MPYLEPANLADFSKTGRVQPRQFSKAHSVHDMRSAGCAEATVEIAGIIDEEVAVLIEDYIRMLLKVNRSSS